MLGDDERSTEMEVSQPHLENHYAQELKRSSVRVAYPRNMSQADEIVTPANGKNVGADEVGYGCSVDDCMKRTDGPVIQSDRRGHKIVRGLHFQSDPIFR